MKDTPVGLKEKLKKIFQGEKKEKQPRTKQQIIRRRLIVLAVAVTVVVSLLAGYKSLVRPPALPADPVPEEKGPDVLVPGEEGEENPWEGAPDIAAEGRRPYYYTFLIVGVDDKNGGGDTLIVASFDAQNKKANFVSIPRDTLINVTWTTKKINSAYNAGGIERLKQEVSKLIGFRVDFYVQVDYQGFIDLVDAIGGVEFDVPYEMNYDDPTQNLHIHVKKGFDRLTGEEAAGVVRWRKNNNGTGYSSGDIGRIETQQAFLSALAKQTLKLSNLTKINQFVNIFNEHVETDLALGSMLWLAEKALSMSMDDITFTTVPGNYNASYYSMRYNQWVSYVTLSIDEVTALVNERLNPYVREVDASMLDIMTILRSGAMSSSTGVLQDPGAATPPTIPVVVKPGDDLQGQEGEETAGETDGAPDVQTALDPPSEMPDWLILPPAGGQEQTDGGDAAA